jgi:glycosyltransferase involved in cell wall biosynthesis
MKPGRSDQLRERLGLTEDDRVVLAPGDSMSAFGHRLAVHALSILHVLDKRYRLLIWGRGREAAALEHLGQKLRQPRLLVNAESRLGRPLDFHELLSAADATIVTVGNLAPVFPMLMCAAAGLPIVAGDRAFLREVFGADSALFVPPDAPRTFAQAVMELFENSDCAARIGAAARRRVCESFNLASFIDSHFDLYRWTIHLHLAPSAEKFANQPLSSADEVVRM